MTAQEPTPGPERPSEAFPTILNALWLVFLILAVQTGVILALGAGGEALGVSLDEHPATLAVANVLAFGLAIWVGWRRSALPAPELFPFRPFPLRLIPAMTATILGAAIILSEVDNLVRSFFPMPQGMMEMLQSVTGPEVNPWASFLLLVVVAPFTEELFFRGLCLRGFLRSHSVKTAVVASALLFAFIHVNPWQFAGTVVAGVILGWWVVETGSLWPAIYGHALNNGVPWLVGRLPGLEIPGFTGGMEGPVEFQPLWLNIVGAVLAGWGIATLIRGFGRDAPGTHDPD